MMLHKLLSIGAIFLLWAYSPLPACDQENSVSVFNQNDTYTIPIALSRLSSSDPDWYIFLPEQVNFLKNQQKDPVVKPWSKKEANSPDRPLNNISAFFDLEKSLQAFQENPELVSGQLLADLYKNNYYKKVIQFFHNNYRFDVMQFNDLYALPKGIHAVSVKQLGFGFDFYIYCLRMVKRYETAGWPLPKHPNSALDHSRSVVASLLTDVQNVSGQWLRLDLTPFGQFWKNDFMSSFKKALSDLGVPKEQTRSFNPLSREKTFKQGAKEECDNTSSGIVRHFSPGPLSQENTSNIQKIFHLLQRSSQLSSTRMQKDSNTATHNRTPQMRPQDLTIATPKKDRTHMSQDILIDPNDFIEWPFVDDEL